MILRRQFVDPLNCGGIFYWGNIIENNLCQRWKADIAFAFLSAIFWLASAILVSCTVEKAQLKEGGGG